MEVQELLEEFDVQLPSDIAPITAPGEEMEENPDFHGASLAFPSLQWPLELLQSEHTEPQQNPAET